MKTYTFKFHGRQTGAIGIFYDITDSYEAGRLAEACSMLYKDYEHIRFFSATVGKKQISQEQFSDAVREDFKTDYKGKGSARK